jgi:Uma2 family endonuclease
VRGKLSLALWSDTSRPNAYLYPDLVVICDERQLDDDKADTLLNPTVIIEVLSPSTEAIDQLSKRHHYLTLESLRAYLLVSQDRAFIEQYTRRADGSWTYIQTEGAEAAITLTPLNCTLRLADIYADVEFDASDTA